MAGYTHGDVPNIRRGREGPKTKAPAGLPAPYWFDVGCCYCAVISFCRTETAESCESLSLSGSVRTDDQLPFV